MSTWMRFGLLWVLFITSQSHGQTLWLMPENGELRSEIEHLASFGIINQAINSWPLPLNTHNLKNHCDKAKYSTPHLCDLLKNKQKSFATLRVSSANDPNFLKHFGELNEEKSYLNLSLNHNNHKLQGRFSLWALEESSDNHNTNIDGSYLQIAKAGWTWGVGNPYRWWGPGWQQGLILSTNARPLPGFYVSRHNTQTSHLFLFKWLGPWHLTTFMTQLESNRVIEKPLFFGVRFNFRPLKSLEIGLSRAAIWAGKGRPKDTDTFFDLLIGKDNAETAVEKAKEPGNQLGGIDITYRRQFFKNQSLRTYVEVIGEDEAGGLPSRPIGLAGFHWALHQSHLSLNVLVEASDTSLDFFKTKIFNAAYNHSTYQSGYRYYGQSIGASTDNDSQSQSLGIWLADLKKRQSGIWLTHAKLNQDGVFANNPVSTDRSNLTLIELWQGFSHKSFEWQIKIGRMNKVPNNLLGVSKKHFGSVNVTYGF